MPEDVASIVPVIHSDVGTDRDDGIIAVWQTDYDQNFCTRPESALIWTASSTQSVRNL